MKKKFNLILILILFIGCIPIDTEVLDISNKEESQLSSLTFIDIPTEIFSKVNDYNSSLGSLTGGIFDERLNDTDLDTDYDQLLIEIEIDVNQSDEYFVIVILDDYGFQYHRSNGDFENRMQIIGFSTSKTFSSGLHNVTVIFNCTEMRSMRLAGPYYISLIELFHVPTGDWIDRLPSEAEQQYGEYIYRIQEQNISEFNEPINTNDIVFHNATLIDDNLEINFTITSFTHEYESMLPYYFSVALKNGTGTIICKYEETMILESNTGYSITLKIPSTYLNAFEQFNGFLSDFPILLFQEIAVVQIEGDYWMKEINMSYASNAYPDYSTVNVSEAFPIQVLEAGDIYNFGSMNVNDSNEFIFYSETPQDLLELQINRTYPLDSWPPEFDIFITNSLGKTYGIHHYEPMSPFIMWNEHWNNDKEAKYIYTRMGMYQGPWYVYIQYPDHGEPQPSQTLTVGLDLFSDSTPPTTVLNTPSGGAEYNQYYGITFEGNVNDDSIITRYELIHDGEILYKFNPFDQMNSGGPTQGQFKFNWFPSHNITGSLGITLRVTDLGNNFDEITRSITITPGTIPSSDSTINKGLEWLRSTQNPDGSWNYYGGSSAGMTAMAALCFIQAGLAYDQVVTDAINFLVNSFDSDDNPSIPGKVIKQSGHMTYETAIAVTTLIAYNATHFPFDSSLDTLIDDVIDWLVYTQNDETWGVNPNDDAWYGGWRYGYDHQSSDLSVSQWVILALATYGYEESGFWEKVILFVERCRGGHWDTGLNQFDADGGFTYTPSTQDWRGQGGGSYGSMTAAGIWGLFLSGIVPNNTNITVALDWIGSHQPEELVGQNPNMGNQFEYYWYLSASKAFIMAGRTQDQWWYDLITEYLNTHMIAENPTRAFWDNDHGQEPPIFATVQAILSQQVFYGDIPMDKLEVTLESEDGSVIYIWNSDINVGYNYTTGIEQSSTSASYSGVLSDKQTIMIDSPTKGEYFVDIFPDAGENGLRSPQQLVLRARALTASDDVIRYRTLVINYQYPTTNPQVLRYKLVLTTVAGIELHFIDINPPVFSYTIRLDNVGFPKYVELGADYDVNVTLTNLGIGTIPTGSVCAVAEDSTDTKTDFSSWSQGSQQTFNFHYTTTGLLAMLRTTVLYLNATDTNPLVIRLEIQIGNQAPTGSINPFSSPINGTFAFHWQATDADGDPLTYTVILVKADGTQDTLESDITDTSYSFDSTAYPDGSEYKLIIKVSDGTVTIDLKSPFFSINNADVSNGTTTTTSVPGLTPGFGFILTLLTLSLTLIIYRKKK